MHHAVALRMVAMNTGSESKGQGISVYFRDPDGSLLEFISYDSRR